MTNKLNQIADKPSKSIIQIVVALVVGAQTALLTVGNKTSVKNTEFVESKLESHTNSQVDTGVVQDDALFLYNEVIRSYNVMIDRLNALESNYANKKMEPVTEESNVYGVVLDYAENDKEAQELTTVWLNSPVTQVWDKDPKLGYWTLPDNIKESFRSVPGKRLGLRSDGVVVWETTYYKNTQSYP